MIGTIHKTTWHGMEAWALENESVRTVIVPEMGAKIVSLLDKRNQMEWLVGPGERPFRKAAYGATFVEQDMSGWDEMFPTITACAYPAPGAFEGTPLPDHGEVWTLPWTVEQQNQGRLTVFVEGRALPYRLTRSAQFTGPATLELSYRLDNLGPERITYLWAAHPQFACGQAAEIVLPPEVDQVYNTLPPEWGWGEPETMYAWPEATAPDGRQVRIDRIGPPDLKLARKFFVPPDVRAGWAGLVRRPEGAWLRLDWSPVEVPYLGIWMDEGALNPESVAAPEPMTGFYDSLAVAWTKREIRVVDVHDSAEWTLAVRLGAGKPEFAGGKESG